MYVRLVHLKSACTDSVWAWSSVYNEHDLLTYCHLNEARAISVIRPTCFDIFPAVWIRGLALCLDICFRWLFTRHNIEQCVWVTHFPWRPLKQLICSPCCSTQPQTFGPLDYESLQKELALKDTVWTKVSPTECNEDSSTTVVYRMENVGDGN